MRDFHDVNGLNALSLSPISQFPHEHDAVNFATLRSDGVKQWERNARTSLAACLYPVENGIRPENWIFLMRLGQEEMRGRVMARRPNENYANF